MAPCHATSNFQDLLGLRSEKQLVHKTQPLLGRRELCAENALVWSAQGPSKGIKTKQRTDLRSFQGAWDVLGQASPFQADSNVTPEKKCFSRIRSLCDSHPLTKTARVKRATASVARKQKCTTQIRIKCIALTNIVQHVRSRVHVKALCKSSVITKNGR